MIKKMWVLKSVLDKVKTRKKDGYGEGIGFMVSSIKNDNYFFKPITITDEDPMVLLRAVRNKYKCSKCGLDVICTSCEKEKEKGSYFADLEVAVFETIKNWDEGV